MKKEKFDEGGFLTLGKHIVNFFESEGFGLKLSFNGGTPTEEVAGYFPDIVAEKEGKVIIIEVVTLDYLKESANLEEVKAISKYVASQPDEKMRFSLMVPSNELDEIKKIVTANSIYVNKFYFLNL